MSFFKKEAFVINGKELAKQIAENIKNEVSKLERKPKLSVIRVGEDAPSIIYVDKKIKMANELGFQSESVILKKETSKEELLEVIDGLNKSDTDAILLQLPLPKHLNEADFASEILPDKDADGFHPENLGALMRGETPYSIPCTPKGILKILEKNNIEIEGRNCVIIGRSNIVGKPLFNLLLNKNATVTVAHSKTKNLKDITKQADILISATGVKNLIKKDMVKKGAVVIDVGISRDEENKVKGDVDFNEVKKIAGYITPVPGGVGPMTVAELMQNTLNLYYKHHSN